MDTLMLVYLLTIELLSENINCDNDYLDSECRRQTLSCSSSSTPCNISCNGDGSCDGTIFDCSSSTECNISCIGDESCRGNIHKSIINCPSNSNCNILCDGLNSCESIQINCPSNTNCSIIGNGQYSLINSLIQCQSSSNCLINCNNIQTCTDLSIDARNTSQLTMNCGNNKNSCKNINLACPPSIDNNKYCQLNGDEGTIHNGIRIFAINSWDDIDLTRYVGKTSNGDNINPMMFCEQGYTSKCDISLSSWNCMDSESQCYRNGIQSFPTPIPTKSPSSPPNNDEITNWALAIGLIIGIFMFCLFVILGWVWCVKQKQNENGKSYDPIDHAHDNDPDGDIMQKDGEHAQHMYRNDVPFTKQSKSMDIVTKSGLHIVNEYSDASKFGGLLPISEEKSQDFVVDGKSNESNDNNPGVTVIEDDEEKEQLIATNNEKQDGVSSINETEEEQQQEQEQIDENESVKGKERG